VATEDAPPFDYRPSLTEALNQWVQGQQDAAEGALQPAVDAGAMPAILALLWFYQQRGKVVEAAPLIEKALSEGIVTPGLWPLGNYMADPQFKQLAVDIIRVASEYGTPYDAIAHWPGFWNQGDQDKSITLFELAARPQPRSLRLQLDDLLGEARAGTGEIQSAAAIVAASRDEAVDAIRAHEVAIGEDRERVEKLVADTTSLVHGATSDHIAKAYAQRAKEALDSAGTWTTWAIVTFVAAAAWAVGVAVHSFRNGDVGTTETIGKVLVSLPILLLAGYVASVAANKRRMGWHWSHVELQIRTAEPFIANLDLETRNRLLAALAIRFFPGQGQDPQQGGASTESLDVGTLISGILHELGPRRGGGAPPDVSPPPTG
jgi:hypothetical protein